MTRFFIALNFAVAVTSLTGCGSAAYDSILPAAAHITPQQTHAIPVRRAQRVAGF